MIAHWLERVNHEKRFLDLSRTSVQILSPERPSLAGYPQ
jgi:hypothetical protein